MFMKLKLGIIKDRCFHRKCSSNLDSSKKKGGTSLRRDYQVVADSADLRTWIGAKLMTSLTRKMQSVEMSVFFVVVAIT